MRLNSLCILLALTLIAALAVAGCTSPAPAGQTATATPRGQVNTTPAAANTLHENTTAPATGDISVPANTTLPAREGPGNATPPEKNDSPADGPIALGSFIDYGKLKWYECHITGSDNAGVKVSDMRMRADFGVDYGGVKATKYTVNADTEQGGSRMTIVSESYVDPSTDRTLGGHIKTIMNGQVVNEMDIPASGGAADTQDPLKTIGAATMSNPEPDTITVQAGKFTCTRYTLSGSVTGTVWFAPGVPVPIKMEGNGSGSDASMELVGWG